MNFSFLQIVSPPYPQYDILNKNSKIYEDILEICLVRMCVLSTYVYLNILKHLDTLSE